MKVLISATNLRRRSIGGGETFACGLASALADHTNHQVGLLLPTGVAERLSGSVADNVRLVPVRAFRGPLRVLGDALLLSWRARDWDIVVFPHEWKPFIRRPVVLVAQNILWMHPATRPGTGVRGRLLRLLVRLRARAAYASVAVSRETAELWASCGGPAPENVLVLPEGIDLPAARHEGSPKSGPLAVTSESAYKGLDLVEEAIDIVRIRRPDYVVDVVGVVRPPRAGRRYHGRVAHADLLAMMADAEVVIVPSRVESFGLPAFEARASGRPCIVAEGSAMSEWLGNSVITFDGTASDLSRALQDDWPSQCSDEDGRFLWANVVVGWAAILESFSSPSPRPD